MSDIKAFVKSYSDKFDLNDLANDERTTLVQSIITVLEQEAGPNNSDEVVEALNAVRILSRDKLRINDWFDELLFNLLMRHSALEHYREEGQLVLLPDNVDTEAVTEATKCLCNLTFNNSKVQSLCAKHRCVLAIIQRAKTYTDESVHHSVKYFDMRLMFIITALVRETRTQATIEWGGVTVLTEVIQQIVSSHEVLPDSACDLGVEVLKTLYNLTLVISPWNEEFSPLQSSISLLVSRVQELICHKCATKEKHLDMTKHCSNLFTTLPGFVSDSLIPSLESSEPLTAVTRSFQGFDVSAIVEILKYLEMVLEESTISSQKDKVLPVVTTLTTLSRSSRIIRKYCRLRILPHLRDEVKRLPEEGDSLRNRLCKLLTTPNTEVKQVVADLLYVLCKENVSRFIKYSGFGNAAGLLAQYGLMRGQRMAATEYSDDSDSETEEYRELEPNINPVTGRYEMERADPMEGMTDEQKEYEAMQLINAMDKLQRLGVVQPSTIGADGKPVPVDHVLQLARDPDGNSDSD